MGPNAATTDGVVFARGGRVYLVNEGGVHSIAIGELLGAVQSSVLVFTCDQAAASSADPSAGRRAVGDAHGRVDGVDVGRWSPRHRHAGLLPER